MGKRGRPPLTSLGNTALHYLVAGFEHKTQSDIARELDVSRQRIQQIERQFRVCHIAHRHHRQLNRCAVCSKPCEYRYCSPGCHFKGIYILLSCPVCHGIFARSRKAVLFWLIRQDQKHFFCSRRCLGLHIAKFGFQPGHTFRPHKHYRKWDWDLVLETASIEGVAGTSRVLGIPHSTIDKILRKSRFKELCA